MKQIINSDLLRQGLVLFTSYFCSIVIFSKLSNTSLQAKQKLKIIFYIIIIPTLSALLKSINFPLYGFVFLFLTIISFASLKKQKYYQLVPTIVLSLGVQYFIEVLSIIVLITPFYLCKYYDVNLITELCTSCLEVLFTFLFIRIKRIKNGLSFLSKKNYFGFSLLIAGPTLFLINIQKDYFSSYYLTIIAICFFISAIGLLLWIRSAITSYYRKKLKVRAEEYSKIELAEKQEEIEKLTNENASLSSIIHLDNHLINMLEITLENYKNDNSVNDLLILSKQRNEYVNSKIINEKLLPTTGNIEIDSAISDMYIKAASRGIDFTLNVDCDINYLIHNIIEQADFEELIRSCITNSIVDIESNPDAIGKIIIKISQPNDIYEFTIMDNGVTNDNNTKAISEIIDKSNASIKTNTFDNNDSFTKSLTIRFDGLKNNTAL